MSVVKWTPELDAKVQALWGEGLSATEISDQLRSELRITFSRSAVCGRLHRKGVIRADSGRHQGRKRLKPAKLPKVARLRVTRAAPTRSTPFIAQLGPVEIQLRCAEIVPRNLAMVDLEPNDCRYPYGDGPFVFCGHPKVGDGPYCLDHLHLTIRPRQERAAA
jgi:GcrA cell cycle regulator